MQLVFVLVGTKHPGNLGAAARALKTMGFSQLRLVNPCAFREVPADAGDRGAAYQMAMYSHDILDNATVFSTLAEAVADCDLTIGTTSKLRHHRHSVLTPPELKESLVDKQSMLTRVALVFGPEDTGLTNEHLDVCELLTTVPLAAVQPSINLAQAVMIYSYALCELPALFRKSQVRNSQVRNTKVRNRQEAETTSYAVGVAEIERAANALGIRTDERVRAWLKERVPLLPARDLRMLFNLLKDKNAE